MKPCIINNVSHKIMCNECCKEFKGWCKSFTRTETLLTILEGILLVLCIAFLIFLILHLIACSRSQSGIDGGDRGKFTTERTEFTSHDRDLNESAFIKDDSKYETDRATSKPDTFHSTLDPDVECTWEPSHKTAAGTRYYEDDVTEGHATASGATETATQIATKQSILATPTLEFSDIIEIALEDQSDGEEADEAHRRVVLALVKPNPPRDVTFGCILTAISERWTLTAASCIEAIEEVDSVDSFVMMEGYGSARAGRALGVAGVALHPRYGGADPAHDVAALRARSPLAARAHTARLPAPPDYLLLTLAERLTLLGFGGFRTISASPAERGVREVRIYTLPARQCAARGGAGWAGRHLSRGAAHEHAACGAAPLCAGALYARGAPCNYCAGAPLVRTAGGGRPLLLGLQADAQQCGVACEPALYVNIALVRDWIDSLLDPDD